jgi:hypothetical protein
MVIPSNLSLIPYPRENYQLQRLIRPMMLPDRELGQQATKRYGLSRRAFTRQHYIHMDDQNLTYSPNCCMEFSGIDHTGSRIDIYI